MVSMDSKQSTAMVELKENEFENQNHVLGHGGMGTVRLYKWKTRGGKYVAVKTLHNTSDSCHLREEAKILWGLHKRCGFILELYGIIESTNEVRLVVDYMVHGNVSDFFLHIKGKAALKHIRKLKLRIAMQVCIAMEFLHGFTKPIIHRDLKAGNVLLDEKLNAKICDFGLAKIRQLTTRPKSDPSQEFGGKHAGTLSHLAPELLSITGRPSTKSDVYSFGIFLWELLSGKIPYEDVLTDLVLIKDVAKGKRPSLGEISIHWGNLKDIMTECWNGNQSQRPNFSKLRQRLSPAADHCTTEDAKICEDAWEQQTPQTAETKPKAVRSGRFGGERYFNTATLSPGNMPQDRDMAQQLHRAPVSDLTSSEVLISAASQGSSTTTMNQYERGEYPDGSSNVPLIEPSTPPPQISRSKCRASKPIMCALMVGLIVGCGIAFAIFWVEMTAIYAGCCINCFDLTDSGIRSNCSVDADSKVSVGMKCSFSCVDGYILNGNTDQLVCQTNGVWSGSLPYCRKIRQCPKLSAPANEGEFKCSNGFYERSTCSFQCKPGYRLRIPGDNSTNDHVQEMSVTCNADEFDNYQWSGQEPYCEKVVQCETLNSDVTVVTECTPDSQDRTNGTVCHLSCKALSMSLEHEESIAYCSSDGKWNTTAGEIKCIKACSSLPDVRNATYNCTNGRLYSSHCTYACQKNFVFVGRSDRDCQDKGPKIGTWSAPPPRCECPSCRSGNTCQNSVSFKETWQALNTTAMKTEFDGRPITCKSTAKVLSKKEGQLSGCQCRDQMSNTNKQCNDQDLSIACYRAYSSILITMSFAHICKLPCDAQDMPVPCKP